MAYLVIDCPFNVAWCPQLIGKVFENPPSYAVVVRL